MSSAYFDARHLDYRQGACPIRGCRATLGQAPSQWGPMSYCPDHRIRIHDSRTFVYYHGSEADSKRRAAARNILFECDYFKQHIIGNKAKAETGRFCNETSEDAVTWNVFSRLARAGLLRDVLRDMTGLNIAREPDMYIWGLRISLDDPTPPVQFPELGKARQVFERGIRNYRTEPDVMLHVPGQLLVLIEAKFTSENTIATSDPRQDKLGEKPKSREGMIKRYHLPEGALILDDIVEPFYSQLYRNLVFAMHMAAQLQVDWAVINLVRARANQNPIPFIQSVLPKALHERFKRHTWEQVYTRHVQCAPTLNDLADYMRFKSAYGVKAFQI